MKWKWVGWLATILTLIGAFNWGLVGAFNYNLVEHIFGYGISVEGNGVIKVKIRSIH